MFSTVRARVNGLDEKQSKYVQAILSGRTEAHARDIAGYKAAPKSETVQCAILGEKVGEFSDAAKNYAFRLAVERISGEPLDEGFETYSMRRGHDLEPKARMQHELQSGLFVERAGFVMTEDGAFGASADGLIGADEGSEYKCFIAPEKLRAFWIDNDPSSVMEQAQGCMWITGRKRWHICLYCPALEKAGKQLWWKVFERDDDYIEKMETDLLEFKDVVDMYEQKLRLKEAA
ncbi:MAG: recombinase [Candidimonas sp.]|nr:MAG: recombinase [Candidimonas sp.]TAM24808.1 MAG: recombinase [Candidimonas sp.]